MRKCFDNTSNVWLCLSYLSPQYIKYQTKVLRKQKLSFDTQPVSAHKGKCSLYEFLIPGSLNTSSADISQTAAITTGHRVGQLFSINDIFSFQKWEIFKSTAPPVSPFSKCCSPRPCMYPCIPFILSDGR